MIKGKGKGLPSNIETPAESGIIDIFIVLSLNKFRMIQVWGRPILG